MTTGKKKANPLWSANTLPWKLDLPWQFITFIISEWQKRSNLQPTTQLWSSVMSPWQEQKPWQFITFIISEWQKRTTV